MKIRLWGFLLLFCMGALKFGLCAEFHDESVAKPGEGFYSEVRVGVLLHDMGDPFKQRHESGADLNAELLFGSPDNAFFNFLFNPRPHVGVSLNTAGGTTQIYGGITWHFDVFSCLFLEASFGGEGHTGRINNKSSNRQALGARFLFREGVSLGVNMGDHHTVSVMLDHASHAGLGGRNPGLTSLGLRYGYKI